jgi:hypothetical protein
MIWEYLVLAAVLAWAVFFLWRTFAKKKCCTCETCPSSTKESCLKPGLGDLRQSPENEEGTEDGVSRK